MSPYNASWKDWKSNTMNNTIHNTADKLTNIAHKMWKTDKDMQKALGMSSPQEAYFVRHNMMETPILFWITIAGKNGHLLRFEAEGQNNLYSEDELSVQPIVIQQAAYYHAFFSHLVGTRKEHHDIHDVAHKLGVDVEQLQALEYSPISMPVNILCTYAEILDIHISIDVV